MNSTFVTNRCRRVMKDWNFNALADRYAMSSDWDDQWRPGGSVDEGLRKRRPSIPRAWPRAVIAFAEDYGKRMEELGAMMDEARG